MHECTAYATAIRSSFRPFHLLSQVLQLPIVKNRLKKMLINAVNKIALLGAPIIPSCEDNLEQFLQVTLHPAP